MRHQASGSLYILIDSIGYRISFADYFSSGAKQLHSDKVIHCNRPVSQYFPLAVSGKQPEHRKLTHEL